MHRTNSRRVIADTEAYRALQDVIRRWHFADSVSDETHRLLTELRAAVSHARNVTYDDCIDLRDEVDQKIDGSSR